MEAGGANISAAQFNSQGDVNFNPSIGYSYSFDNYKQIRVEQRNRSNFEIILANYDASGGDPYQNSHGEPVYTMEEFINANQGLTRNEIINQRQDRSKTFLSSQPGGPNMRYVINPHDGRVIDMRHMLVVGKSPAAVGNLLEVGQWIRGQASGMDRQDFYSNGVGYQFYRQYSPLQNVFLPKTFTNQINNFFSNPRIIINW
jgi:hypothetical protein